MISSIWARRRRNISVFHAPKAIFPLFLVTFSGKSRKMSENIFVTDEKKIAEMKKTLPGDIFYQKLSRHFSPPSSAANFWLIQNVFNGISWFWGVGFAGLKKQARKNAIFGKSTKTGKQPRSFLWGQATILFLEACPFESFWTILHYFVFFQASV